MVVQSNDLLKKIDEKLNSNKAVILTKEEVTAIKQEMKRISTKVLEWGKLADFGTKTLNEQNQTILKLDTEIAIAEDFIFSKGFRKEYRRFKDKKINQTKGN